ncbi:O-antigen ligase family protein [Polaribacter sejongensis]|uniref:O-antigen ligase family protein n=1 Tax=Polaribacter sejongensis TaxID=985043 RepID=UPI0035A5D08A
MLGVIISGIIQAIYGNLQLLGYYTSNHSGFNLTGSFFNPGPYAGFLTIVFSIALGFYLFKEKVISYLSSNIKSKYYLTINTIIKYVFEYIPLIGIVSIIIVIPATQSRASWLAIIITSFFIFELRYQIIKKKLKQLTKVKKTFLIITTSLIIALALSGVYNLKKGSSDGRLFIWKISTKIIKDNPVFGVGFDRFKVYYMNAQAHYFAEMGETAEALVADNTYYAFNEFIQFITENGIVGFILLIVILYLILNTSTKKENKCLNNIVKTSLLSICVFAFFPILCKFYQ